MDVYLINFDLKPGVRDLDFARNVASFLDHMKQHELIVSWRLLRRKLGFGPREQGEWQIHIETRDLAQLDNAFRAAAMRTGETERVHFDVNRHATNLTFSLLRDFPDDVRKSGEELF